MTKDEFQKAVDDAITDCIRNDCAFGSYAHKVTEAVWPLLEAAEKERDDVAHQLVQSEIGKREISEAHNAVTRRLSVLADENTALRAEVIHTKEVEFPRKAQAVADGWRGKCERLEAKIAEMEWQKPVRHEFQGRDGAWYPFIDQRHYENTVADGTWPIRALYALPGAKGE